MSILKDKVFEGNLTCLTIHDRTRLLSCGLIENRFDFQFYGLMDNFECCTIKLMPKFWADDSDFRYRLYHYCSYNNMNYYLIPEVGASLNLHYHGLISFPDYKVRRRFTSWLNKGFGKFFVGTKTEINGWYNYVTKGIKPEETFYLFDEKFDPNITVPIL